MKGDSGVVETGTRGLTLIIGATSVMSMHRTSCMS